MAENVDYITNCPVCFEAYQVSGENVPKLLPCSHSLCKKCLRKLLPSDGELKCPQCRCPLCRNKCKKNKDERSFPENQYIVTYLKYKTEKEKEDMNKCPKHQKELNLFCNAPECKCLTCTKCMKEDHKDHDFVVVDVQKEKNESLVSDIKSLKEGIESKREKLLASKKQLEVNNASLISIIASTKQETIRKITAKITVKFDSFTEEMKEQYLEMKQKIDEQLRMLEYSLNMLEDIGTQGQEDEDVMADETIFENKAFVKVLKGKIETNVWKTDVVNYVKYVEGEFVEDLVETLCGRVEFLRLDVTAGGTVEYYSHCNLRFAITFLSHQFILLLAYFSPGTSPF